MHERDDQSGRQFPIEAIAVGTLVSGAALLLAGLALQKGRKKRAASEDSPIMIKGGSLSVALHDNATWAVTKETDKSYTVTSRLTGRRYWHVSVATLEAGFPVRNPPTFTIPDVSRLTLSLVEDEERLVDTITVVFSNGVLTFSANEDDGFGDVRLRTVKKSYKHKKRVFHKKIGNTQEFEIGKITVESGGASVPFPPAGTKDTRDYVLAFDFSDRATARR